MVTFLNVNGLVDYFFPPLSPEGGGGAFFVFGFAIKAKAQAIKSEGVILGRKIVAPREWITI